MQSQSKTIPAAELNVYRVEFEVISEGNITTYAVPQMEAYSTTDLFKNLTVHGESDSGEVVAFKLRDEWFPSMSYTVSKQEITPQTRAPSIIVHVYPWDTPVDGVYKVSSRVRLTPLSLFVPSPLSL